MKNLLFQPFQKIGGEKSAVYGTFLVLLTVLIAANSNTHFPDIISVKILIDLPLWALLVQQFIIWLSNCLIFFILAKLLTKANFRIIDLFGTQLLSRFPYLPASFLGFSPQLKRFSEWSINKALHPQNSIPINGFDITISSILLILVLGLTVWLIALMYQSYKISTNLKGNKLIISFIAGTILSLLVSLTLNYLFIFNLIA